MNHSTPIISGRSEAEGLDDPAELAPEVELRELAIGPDGHGARLDRALVGLLPEFSRSHLQQLIASGAVQVNGLVLRKAAARVQCADACRVELRPTAQSQAFAPEAMPLCIVHEDEHLLVINKPAGLVVHPAPGNWRGTLLNGLLARAGGAALLPRAGIVHRLDKDTSGLMVVAQTRATMDALVQAIAARTVSRQYLAVAHQPWQGPAAIEIDAPVGRDPRNRLRMAVVDLERQSGKPAQTRVELLGIGVAGCLLRCTLHTGRTHQIRVHLASIGHPLVADAVYGGAPAGALGRQALHAMRLAFVHPITGQALAFRAPAPDDIVQLMLAWGLRYNER